MVSLATYPAASQLQRDVIPLPIQVYFHRSISRNLDKYWIENLTPFSLYAYVTEYRIHDPLAILD